VEVGGSTRGLAGALSHQWQHRAIDAAVVAAATAVSLGLQGFAFGVSNNAFHVPIVLGWFDLPEFADDTFHGSLRRFVSVVWPALRAITTEDNIVNVFFGAHVISRASALAAILYVLRRVHLSRSSSVIGLALLTAAPTLYGYSRPAWHGLFVEYFTHTETTWAAILVALTAVVERRWIAAGAIAGTAALLNLFVGIWLLVVAFLRQLAAATFTQALRSATGFSVAFACVSSPVLIWTLWALATPPADFDYREYIRDYFPAHFLIEAAKPSELVNTLSLWLCAFLCCRLSGLRHWQGVLLALMGIFAVGVVAPYVANIRLVFNLHLLRVDGVFWFISAILLTATAMRSLSAFDTDERLRPAAAFGLAGLLSGSFVAVASVLVTLVVVPTRHHRLVSGTLTALAVAGSWATVRTWPVAGWVSPSMWALAALAIVLSRPRQDPTRTCHVLPAGLLGFLAIALEIALDGGGTRIVMVTVVAALITHAGIAPYAEPFRRGLPAAALVAIAGLSFLVALAQVRHAPPALTAETASQKERDWLQTAAWFRANPGPGPVLIPVHPEDDVPHRNFSIYARVPVWVDRKQGAAVMWFPSFQSIWRERLEEVRPLRSASALGSYAALHRIPRYVAPREDTVSCHDSDRLLFQTPTFVVCHTDTASWLISPME
jgi:hypothetical protein